MAEQLIESPLVTEGEAADLLRSNVRTLQRWRHTGEGPMFVKIGRGVRYRRVDLEVWLADNVRESTSSAGPTIDRREQVLIASLATYLVDRELREVRRTVHSAEAKQELVDRLHTAIEQALEDEVEALQRDLEPFK